MPTVEFSPVLLDRIAIPGGAIGMFGTPSYSVSQGQTPSTAGFGNFYSRIILFPGTIPAQPRLMTSANFSTTLVHWSIGNNQYTTLSIGATSIITTSYVAAIATGTATWFAWCFYTGNPPATGGSLQNRIIGTVGTIGSGADLEMVTTSIVTGNQYRVYNLQMTLPSTYTY